MIKGQTACGRCGQCCSKGGPALHRQDLPLITNQQLSLSQLVTIRRGEPTYSPVHDHIEPAQLEFIKIAGRGSSWQCCFYQEGDHSCGRYQHRPLECQLLQCWNPQKLVELIYNNCLQRKDLLPASHPLWQQIASHEQYCSFEKLSSLAAALASPQLKTTESENLAGISQLIKLDLSLRAQAVEESGLSLAQELFYFGRPMFQSLDYYGLRVQEQKSGLEVFQK